MATEYRVRVTNEFTSITGAAVRRRAGIEIAATGDGFVGELTKDQLAELAEDQYVTVEKIGAEEAAAAKARIKATKTVKVQTAEADATAATEAKTAAADDVTTEA